MRKLIAGTGWKMNIGGAEALRYAVQLLSRIDLEFSSNTEIYVLPPFTSLYAAQQGFKDSPIGYGGQNMHWDDSGSWTGEISAPMLREAGCRYVELGHSERLQHFGETYEQVKLKVDQAIKHELTPIICLGESAIEKNAGKTDEVLEYQILTSLSGQPVERTSDVILAYEPRWAISGAEAASPDYIAEQHYKLREVLRKHKGNDAADQTRIIYGGSVNPENAPDIIKLEDVDGLFVGRAAWMAEGFAQIISIVNNAAAQKKSAQK